jgi:hypothetical protein
MMDGVRVKQRLIFLGGSVVEDDAEEGGVDLEAAVVLDEAEFSEFVHEEIDAGAGGADHFGEHFLGNFGEHSLRFIFLAVAGEEQEGASEALLAGVEELVYQVLFDADVSGKHERDEAVGKGVLMVEDADHFLLFND